MLKRLLWLIPFAPPLLLGGFLLCNAVDCPFWDEWSHCYTFLHARDGTLTPQHLFSQANEHRIPVLRAGMLLLSADGRWDTRRGMAVSFLIAATVLTILASLIRKHAGRSNWPAIALTIFASAFVFSPLQYENWLWGDQWAMFVPGLCLCLACVINTSAMRFGIKFALNVLLALLSQYSFGNGLLLWLLLPMTLINPFTGILREHWRALVLWFVLACVAITAYFWGYQHPEQHSPLTHSLRHPVALLKFMACYAACPITSGLILSRKLHGLIAVLVYSFLALGLWQLWRRRNDRPFCAQAMPWLMLALAGLGSGAMAALGRATINDEAGLTARYAAPSLFLVFPAFVLAAFPLFGTQVQSTANPHRLSKLYLRGCAIVLGSVLMISYVKGYENFVQMSEARRASKATLLCARTVQTSDVTSKLFPAIDEFHSLLKRLDDLGLFRDRPLHGDFRELTICAPEPDIGRLASMRSDAQGKRMISGWALHPPTRGRARSVVLTYATPDGHLVPFAVGDLGMDEAEYRSDIGYAPRSGWEILSSWYVPEGATINAWSCDPEKMRAWKLAGECVWK
ncbi:MAG TPA: hypothetical protein VGP72_30420 [Planctomycetota bacterium]|jgi:hypothetical protein